MNAASIVESALAARTIADAKATQTLIEKCVGTRHERPLADRWNNAGLISAAGGSFDLKVIENITNMQDAMLERAALRRFGEMRKVAYKSPREAAEDLFENEGERAVGDGCSVEFYESDPPTRDSKRITIAFRDYGCGLTPASIPKTIFHLGSAHKEGVYWLQGAFGLGGATTFKNAGAVILVTRRAPELLREGEVDRIAVAVLEWRRLHKQDGAFYLVTKPYESEQDAAEPFSIPASDLPAFEPGTYLALISYGVEGYHRARLGDERSFDTVLNTRLFKPITPIRFSNHIHPGRDRNEYLRGLERRLRDNPRPEWRQGAEILPYHYEHKTYHLPIRFIVFAEREQPGERRRYVAYDHAVGFTSNGQVHHHWSPQDFKLKTHLNKLYDRILVVVETDDLPIELRTSLFTADRSGLVRNDAAILLEEQVSGFIEDWNELREINAELIREAIAGDDKSAPALKVAEEISRAMRVRGFSLSGATGASSGSGGNGSRSGKHIKIELLPDPTILEGPETVTAEAGKTKFVTLILNAVDDFLPKRGTLQVECNHPDVTPREFTVGPLRAGRVRVSVAIPGAAELGTFALRVRLAGWLRAAGGLGPDLCWSIRLEVTEQGVRPRSSAGTSKGNHGPTEGAFVAVLWRSTSNEGWDSRRVGDVEQIEAKTLAEARPEYAQLSSLGDQRIPTILLNREHHALKRYLGARAKELTDDGMERTRGRYAVGVGVGLLSLDADVTAMRRKEEKVSEPLLIFAKEAIARAVISNMPEFDALAREAGLED
jgi:hypothetical protein